MTKETNAARLHSAHPNNVLSFLGRLSFKPLYISELKQAPGVPCISLTVPSLSSSLEYIIDAVTVPIVRPVIDGEEGKGAFKKLVKKIVKCIFCRAFLSNLYYA